MPCSQGLCVVPCSFVRLRLTPPNSLAVVWPANTAPPRVTIRSTIVAVSWPGVHATEPTPRCPATPRPASVPSPRSARRRTAWSRRQSAAARRAASRSSKHTALRSLASTAANTASSSSTGERSPERNASTSPTASPVHVSLHAARTVRAAYDRRRHGLTHVSRTRTDPQPVSLEAAGHRGHLDDGQLPVRRLRSRRGDLGAGGHVAVASACGRPPSTCRTRSPARSSTSTSRSRSTVIRSPRRAPCATSATARSSPSTRRWATGRSRRRVSGSTMPADVPPPGGVRAAAAPSRSCRGTINDRLEQRLVKGRPFERPRRQRAGRRPDADVGPHPRRDRRRRRRHAGDPRRLRADGRRPGARRPRRRQQPRQHAAGVPLVPTEWVLLDIRVHAVERGFGHGLVHMFAEDGTLLATASQCCIVRFWKGSLTSA